MGLRYVILVMLAGISLMPVFGQNSIFTDDFSNPNIYTFVTNGSGTWSIGTAAPSGPNSSSMGTINSASGGNFALFDSDLFSSGSQDVSLELDSVLNCSALSQVIVCFAHYLGSDTTYANANFEVSTDGGSTWTQYYVGTNLTPGIGTTNPKIEEIDISAVAVGQAFVTFRWTFTADGSTDPFCLAWMIDDVVVHDVTCYTLNSIEEIEAPNVLVHPNPGNGLINIEVNKEYKSARYELFGLDGKLYMSGASSHHITTLDCSNLSPGVYSLVLRLDGYQTTRKVVVY